MPSKTKKRKADNSEKSNPENLKALRVGTSTDAPTSAKINKGATLFLLLCMLTYNHITFTENVAQSVQRAVRSTRGQGGHAYQLENAIRSQPSRTYGKGQRNNLIPDIPENAMAPPEPRRRGNNKVSHLFIWWQRVSH